MKNIKLHLSLFIATTMLFSCSKYEDGPAISLRSKKERIANTWKVERAYDDGQDVSNDFEQYELQMLIDGDASLAALYSFASFNFEFETSGTWEFEDKKSDLSLDFENDDADRTYEILKLKEEELWLKEKGGDLELHLEPK